MARNITPPQIGNFYHVYNRGNNRQPIFFERENYLYFLRLVRQHLVTNGIDVVAYCLMPNHYHFLVHLSAETLTPAMKALSLAYTKAINKRFNRVGALFQGRFQRLQVADPAYLVNLTHYIHHNPVKANLVQHPQAWEFSSYLDYAGLRSGTLPQTEHVKVQIGSIEAYQQFLNDRDRPASTAFKQLLFD